MPQSSRYSDERVEKLLAQLAQVLQKDNAPTDLSLMVLGNMVTNVINQAKRLGDRTAMMLHGKILDLDSNDRLFNGEVKDPRTKDYIEGLFG